MTLMMSLILVVAGPSLMELREKRGSYTGDFSGSIRGGHSNSRSIDEIEKQPYFLPTKTVVTVQEGSHAFFICKVENLYNQTVSTARALSNCNCPTKKNTRYFYILMELKSKLTVNS